MKILVATDGSKPALEAVRFAAGLIGQLSPGEHGITLLSVHDDTALAHARSYVGREAVDDFLREASEKDVLPARQLLEEAGVRHDVMLRTGHVSQEIVACAKSGSFDLIVLGSKGRAAIADLLLGSVAQRVLATAQTPVLLVK